MDQGKKILFYAVVIIVGLFFLFEGLKESKPFLAPVLTAVVLAMVVLPLSRKLERQSVKRSLAAILCTTFLFMVSLAFLTLISYQVKIMINDWALIKQKMKPEIEQAKTFIFEHTPLDKNDLGQYNSGKTFSFSLSSEQMDQAMSYMNNSLGLLGTFLLIFIYIFFLLNYRSHLIQFILKLISTEKKGKATKVIRKSIDVVQDYLIGRLILMGILTVLYSIGLGLSGVQNFIIISIIASLLTIIPWIGNILGMALAMIFGYLTTGDIGILIGIIITFTLSQFLESYVLQPYIVGDKVGVHPLIIILTVILGGLLWGMIGMVLAIPVTAIITIVFLNITPVKPLGFLFSKEKEE